VTIAEVFFPASNPTVSLLITFGTFGLDCLVRSLGAVIIGTYADRAGRKAGLTLSIGLMLIGTTLMVITPSCAYTTIVNIRQDRFERTPSIRGETLNEMGGGYMNDFYAREFWRFVLVQHAVAALGQTAIEYPPMQAPATFNLEAVKRQIDELIKDHESR
jgi:MFS family permease